VTSDPRAFFALDLGAATTSAALVGRVDGRWRLLGSTAFPAAIPVESIIRHLADGILAADPALAWAIDVAALGPVTTWPRLAARSAPPATVAVLASSEEMRVRLASAAAHAGWRVTSASLERDDPLGLMGIALDRRTTTVLAGSADPPAGADRQRATTLAALVDAIAERRPELTVVVAGSLGVAALPRTDGAPGPAVAERLYAPISASARAGTAPGPLDGEDGDPLRAFLERLRARPGDAAAGIARATASLATVLGRRVETVAIGLESGSRVYARPPVPAEGDEPTAPIVRATLVPDAGLVPEVLDDSYVDGVLAWSTVSLDRIRLRDRLRELRRFPWGDADGDGAALRLAVARAALVRLVYGTLDYERLAPPDLLVATGGVFCSAPGPAIALALADTLRRPGACSLAIDHARLLAPLGSIPNEGERRRLIADLADDLLAPLGSVVSPQGLHAGRSAGRLTVHAGTGSSALDLVPGGLQLVDLPPGQVATAEFEFRDLVRLGTRGRHFSVEVGGGLGGLLVDLRDVPLRLPDRIEHRRELLAAWQNALWVTVDS